MGAKRNNFRMVLEFHRTYGQPVGVFPAASHLDQDRELLRNGFIMEEYEELLEAQGWVRQQPTFLERLALRLFPRLEHNYWLKQNEPDVVEIADALTDISYFVYGSAIEYGVDLDACFAEVHASNMSKLGTDGKPIYRDDGKVLKGPSYFKPDLAKVLQNQKSLTELK